jgi:hypothetical protein
MTQEFKFVDDVWTEQGGQRLTVALSENGEIVKFTLHCLEQRTITVFKLRGYQAYCFFGKIARALSNRR